MRNYQVAFKLEHRGYGTFQPVKQLLQLEFLSDNKDFISYLDKSSLKSFITCKKDNRIKIEIAHENFLSATDALLQLSRVLLNCSTMNTYPLVKDILNAAISFSSTSKRPPNFDASALTQELESINLGAGDCVLRAQPPV